jgi:Coenzyme PQQ synthesis protein D (PqqD)
MSKRLSNEPAGNVLDVAIVVPEHVIFRSFAQETVALNLQTGTFHGLNPTAGRMVELAARARLVREAVPALAAEYGVSEERIANDLEGLLRSLIDRGLVEIDD